MVKKLLLSIVLSVALPGFARAQGFGHLVPAEPSVGQRAGAPALDRWTPPLPTPGERRAAEIASNVTVYTLLALDVVDAFRSEHRTRALVLTGVRVGATQGASFGLKKLFSRRRPCSYGLSGSPEVHGYNYAESCGSDDPDYSMPSGHSATAWSTLGGPRLAITVPLSVSTQGLRVAAGKHWLTDTLVGAGIGLATSRIR